MHPIRLMFCVSLGAALLFCSACGPARPMTMEEFNGFCYQSDTGGRFKDCDTISVCGPYNSVMSIPQGSLGKCLSECESIHDSQVFMYTATGCAGVNDNARDWCQRYCRTNYPQ